MTAVFSNQATVPQLAEGAGSDPVYVQVRILPVVFRITPPWRNR